MNPGIRRTTLSVLSEQKKAFDGGNLPALVRCDQLERLKIASLKCSHRGKQLGRSSEVDPLRVQLRHGLLVIGLTLSESPHSLNQLLICTTIGRANADVRARFSPSFLRKWGRLALGWA